MSLSTSCNLKVQNISDFSFLLTLHIYILTTDLDLTVWRDLFFQMNVIILKFFCLKGEQGEEWVSVCGGGGGGMPFLVAYM